MQLTIEELKKYIDECDAQYYEPDESINNGMPLVSDIEYDQLVTEYYKRQLLGEKEHVAGHSTKKF